MSGVWDALNWIEKQRERILAARDANIMQLGAGAIENTVANSSRTPGTYRPAIVDTLPALVGTVATLVKRKQMDGSNAAERWINNSMDRARHATENTNRTLGIKEPSNTLEMGSRVLGSLLIPGPDMLGAGKAIAEAAPAVARIAAATPRIVKGAARVATDMVLPLGQAKSVKGLAAAAGIGTAIGDTVTEHTDPTYHSNVQTAIKDRPADFFDDIQQAGDEAHAQVATTATAPQEDFFDQIQKPLEPEQVDKAEEDHTQSNWTTAAEVLGALGLGTAAVKFGPQMFGKAAQDAVDEIPTFTGKKFRRAGGGIGERVKSAIIQQDQPLRNAAEDQFSPKAAQQYKFDSDLINNVSIGSRVGHFLRTGKMPKTGLTSVKLGAHAQAYAKELTLDEQRTVSDALLAQSALDDFNRTGTLSALNLDRDGNTVTPAKLRSMVTTARANPKYAKYMDAIVKSYQDLLDFRVKRGTLSPEMAAELKTKRPNYVRMARDLETEARKPEARPYNANEHVAPGFERADEELQGVQGVTGVGNPFNTLIDDWANHIRIADVNDLRTHWLENMNQANPQLVRRIPNGVKPNTTEGIHTIQKNGVPVSYKVNDEIMSNALEYAPRASFKGVEIARQIAQNTVTGPLGTLANGFAIFKSPIYDTTIGMLNKPDNIKLGLINEALGKLAPGFRGGRGIGRLDPTALISAYTGAARYAWDDLRGSMAQNLSDQLLREHTWLRGAIGDQNVTALRDSLEQAYQNSIKSLMDEQGITSHTMHGSPDPSKVLSGLDGIAPRFTTAMSDQLARDTMEARKAGEVGPLKPLLQNGTAAFGRVKASAIARTYGGLLDAMHNGFRYSTVASNLANNKNLRELASQARRISVDSAQHGGSNLYNKTIGGFMYGNLTVQTLNAVGERFIKNPGQFLGNLSSVVLPLVAMHYSALASDPKAAEQHAGKSASQKAATVTTFGGAEIPIDPVLRMIIGPLFTVLDHATGAYNGHWNRPMLDSLINWIGDDKEDESFKQDMSDVFWADVKANNPIAVEAFPGTAPILASFGIDPGMTRVANEASPVHMQGVSGFDPDQKQTDSLTSGNVENMIAALTGTFGQNLLSVANDAHRAYHATGDMSKAMEMGLNRYRDTMAKGSAEMRPMLFGNYEQTKAVTDTNYNIVKGKEAGIDLATQIYNKNVKGNDVTDVAPKKAVPVGSDTDVPDAKGTANAYIGAAAISLNKTLKQFNDRIGQLTEQSEGVRNGYVTKQQDKNHQLNEIVAQRKYYTLMKRQVIENYEKTIGDTLGNPDFSFDDYNPDDYTGPMSTLAQ